jgi:hypothetical protein
MPNVIFLSYSQIDNDVPQPAPGQQAPLGWVTTFHRHLQQQLSVAVGQRWEVWLDRNNHRLNNNLAGILQEVGQAAILVTVVSPAHAGSDWCRAELITFLGRNPNFPRSKRDLSSTFAVQMYPLDDPMSPLLQVLAPHLAQNDPLRNPLAQNLPYQFFDAGPPPLTLQSDWPEQRLLYHKALAKLVSDLKQMLPRPKHTTLALLGGGSSQLLDDVRKGVAEFRVLPSEQGWPIAIGARNAAVTAALNESSLAIFVFERGSSATMWQDFDRAIASPRVTCCMVWLNEADAGLDPERFKQLREAPPAKCELYEANRYEAALFVQAVRENLEMLEKMPPAVIANATNPKPPVHVVFRPEDEPVADLVFAEAKRSNVETISVPFVRLDDLMAAATNARSILMASRDGDAIAPLMRRVSPRLTTRSRGGVGFKAQAPRLEGDFRWLGEDVSGVFNQFPP